MRYVVKKLGVPIFLHEKKIPEVISLKMSSADLEAPGYWTTDIESLMTTSSLMSKYFNCYKNILNCYVRVAMNSGINITR